MNRGQEVNREQEGCRELNVAGSQKRAGSWEKVAGCNVLVVIVA